MLYTLWWNRTFHCQKGAALCTLSTRCQFKLDGIGQQCVAFGGFGFGQAVAAGDRLLNVSKPVRSAVKPTLTPFSPNWVSVAIIQQLLQLELHAAQLCDILCVLLCDNQVIFGILQLVGQSQLQGVVLLSSTCTVFLRIVYFFCRQSQSHCPQSRRRMFHLPLHFPVRGRCNSHGDRLSHQICPSR